MALVENGGDMLVHGRFGDLQVAADGYDTEVAVPSGSTHVDIHQDTDAQQIFYSLSGGASSWIPLPPAARPEHTASSYVIAVGSATKVYFRKARKIRQIATDPGLLAWGGADARERICDDCIGKISVVFNQN
jgi:hypothetical protein